MGRPSLKSTLENLYRTFDFKGRLVHDPISIPAGYVKNPDIEVSAFISAAYAYGRVDLFLPVLKRIMELMGGSPYEFVMGFSVKKHARLLSDISYRFNRPHDLVGLLYSLRRVITKHGSLERAFLNYSSPEDTDIGPGLSGMMAELRTSGMMGAFRSRSPEGFAHYFPSPATGGAAKRGALFLRWMVRDRDIDFGIWKGASPSKLVIPLDTHIARVSRCLGLTRRKSNDWKTAVDITESLRKLDPEDPLKYDFALCHRGISGVCSEQGCADCTLVRTKKRP